MEQGPNHQHNVLSAAQALADAVVNNIKKADVAV
jgi:hypothetical protein